MSGTGILSARGIPAQYQAPRGERSTDQAKAYADYLSAFTPSYQDRMVADNDGRIGFNLNYDPYAGQGVMPYQAFNALSNALGGQAKAPATAPPSSVGGSAAAVSGGPTFPPYMQPPPGWMQQLPGMQGPMAPMYGGPPAALNFGIGAFRTPDYLGLLRGL